MKSPNDKDHSNDHALEIDSKGLKRQLLATILGTVDVSALSQ